MARQSVRVRFASYRGGIPGQERLSGGKGSLHLGPKGSTSRTQRSSEPPFLESNAARLTWTRSLRLGSGRGPIMTVSH